MLSFEYFIDINSFHPGNEPKSGTNHAYFRWENRDTKRLGDFSQGRLAGKGQSWDWNPGSLAPQSVFQPALCGFASPEP